MRPRCSLLSALLAGLGFLLASPDAVAGARSAQQALKEKEDGTRPYNVVQNRFFLKGERFELAPAVGVVPNNPFVKRAAGGVFLAYHFNETLAAEGTLLYAPDLGEADLKDLTHTLVVIAEEGGSDEFKQPLDKMTLGASFAARWSPIYGKINLIGESVINFDLYGTAGLGMLSLKKYNAVYSDAQAEQGLPPAVLEDPTNKVAPTINLGLGLNFFVTSAIAVKLDARNFFYFGPPPSYTGKEDVTALRLYDDFVASVGVSIFFPSMQPRQVNF